MLGLAVGGVFGISDLVPARAPSASIACPACVCRDQAGCPSGHRRGPATAWFVLRAPLSHKAPHTRPLTQGLSHKAFHTRPLTHMHANPQGEQEHSPHVMHT